jgi:hypothetical protein
MDLKAITTLLTNQESTFRTILSSASPSISGDALKSKLTQHYINLVLLARDNFPPSNDSLDDPFEFLSDHDNPYSSFSSSSSRKRRDPPAQGQMEAVPVEKTTPRYANWQKAGGATLFVGVGGGGSGGRMGGKGKRKSGKGVAVPIIDLCHLSDDDSASSLVDEEERRLCVLDISKAGLNGKGKEVLNREEKEEERERGREPGIGLGLSGKSSGLMVLIENTKSLLRDGMEKEREVTGVDDEIVAGLEGGKGGEGGEGNDQAMEEGIAYYEDGDDEAEVFNEVEKENGNKNEQNGEGGEEGGTPTKRRRCL